MARRMTHKQAQCSAMLFCDFMAKNDGKGVTQDKLKYALGLAMKCAAWTLFGEAGEPKKAKAAR